MGVRVSREGAGANEPKPPPAAGTPIWVWVIYALGLFALAIFVFSILFTVGAKVLSDDLDVTYDVSTPAILLWGALIVAAAVTWIVRRRQRR
jgi:glucan phosphoethanolaminetransferase (alkaline phosphatase superfamily)